MILDEDIQEQKQAIKLSDKEIFIKIWSSPRLVFKYINDNSYDKFVTVLLVLAGISSTFDRASSKNMGDSMSLATILAICVIVGGLLGWISYYIYAATISWTGKWLKGQGNTKSVLRIIAHAMIPSIVTLVLLIPQIALFGKGIFQSEIDLDKNGWIPTIVFYTTLSVEFVLGIWTLVIFIIGISEVQKISIGKSILNVILPILLLIIPLAIIVSVFALV